MRWRRNCAPNREKYRRTAEQLEEAGVHIQRAEEAVRRSDRLAALGQLSAGLAHELRNPLGTIKASAEMLSRNVAAENEVAREMAGFIASEVDRTNSLVTRFCNSRARSNCGWTTTTWRIRSTAPSPPWSARRRRSRFTGTTRLRSRRFPSMPS